ncbi:DUF7266 family protein [Halosimplex sp. J119]
MRAHSTDDRGVSTQISHVFGIAITSLLVVVLLNGMAGYVQDERAKVADSQLETIGNQLASQVERADELGQHGGEVSVKTTVDSTVVGNSYRVSLAEGDPCDTGAFHTDSCLVLEGESVDATAKVPVNLTSDVELEDEGGGTFVMTVVSAGGVADSARPVADHHPRIGVGRSFEVDRFGTVVSPVNRPPIAKFTFSPGMPRSGDETEFKAGESFDVDGDIVAYKWRLGSDGTLQTLGQNFTRELDPGPQEVTLQVVDNEGATSNVTQRVRVSGLAYEEDLTDSEEGAEERYGDSREGAINFTVTNEYATDIELTEVLVDPKDDTLRSIGNNCDDDDNCPFEDEANVGEIVVAKHGDNGRADSITDLKPEVSSGGIVVELEERVSLSHGESAEIWTGAFAGNSDLTGTEFDIGVRYQVAGRMNSTVFTDTAGSTNVEEFRIETEQGSDNDRVDLVVVADQKLDTIEADLGGDLSGTESGIDNVVQTASGDYRHELNYVDTLTSGTVKANLTVAERDGVSAYETLGSKSINRTVTLFDGDDYVWQDASDWDDGDSYGVVHRSLGDRQADRVTIGYPASGSGLMGYWPLDDTPDDASGNGNHASEENDPGTGLGVFGTQAYRFDGDDDHLTIENDPTLEMSDTDEVTVSMWVNKDSEQSGYRALFQHSDRSYNLHLTDGNRPGFTIYDDYWRSNAWWQGLESNRWYHIVGVFEENWRRPGGTIKTYVNGELKTTTYAQKIAETHRDIGIASNIDDRTGGRHFDGKIDEIRVYDRALDDSEVEGLYERSGILQTDWKGGSQNLDSSNMALQYNASIPEATSINVTVIADTDGDSDYGDPSDDVSEKISLRDGQHRVAVDGLPNEASNFRLKIEFDSASVVKSPVLHKVGLAGDS